MTEQDDETALAMLAKHGSRAGYIALRRAADAWSKGDYSRKAHWRAVVAEIARLQVPADASETIGNEHRKPR